LGRSSTSNGRELRESYAARLLTCGLRTRVRGSELAEAYRGGFTEGWTAGPRRFGRDVAHAVTCDAVFSKDRALLCPTMYVGIS
jgi:hypothetical protein